MTNEDNEPKQSVETRLDDESDCDEATPQKRVVPRLTRAPSPDVVDLTELPYCEALIDPCVHTTPLHLAIALLQTNTGGIAGRDPIRDQNALQTHVATQRRVKRLVAEYE